MKVVFDVSTSWWLKTVGWAVLCYVGCRWLLGLAYGYRVIRNTPGRFVVPLDRFTPLAFVLRKAMMYPPRHWFTHYAGKFHWYAKTGSTCLSAMNIWNGKPQFWFADAEAIRILSSDRSGFGKDLVPYKMLAAFGPNLIGVEGSEWKRHRGVVNPAFSEANNALIWSETIRIALAWFDHIKAQGIDAPMSQRTFDVRQEVTNVTFDVICSAGFGQQTDQYSTQPEPPSMRTGRYGGRRFHQILETCIATLPIKRLAPTSLFARPRIFGTIPLPFLGPVIDRARTSFEALREHLVGIVDEVRRNDAAQDGSHAEAQLVRRLVQANMQTDTDAAKTEKAITRHLSDDELISNMFLFVLAGHETTAHTLTFALVLLALNPEVQAKVRQEVDSIWPHDSGDAREPTYKDDYPKFEYTLAVFRETLRCFPPVSGLPKYALVDTILPATMFRPCAYSTSACPSWVQEESYDGDEYHSIIPPENLKDGAGSKRAPIQKFDVHIPKGSLVVLDIWGTHMNPLHWGPDAHMFKPERFIDTETNKWPRDAFIPFSTGQRSCIGNRFSMTEGVALLALFVRTFDINLPPSAPTGLDGQRPYSVDVKRFMTRFRAGITMTPLNAYVRLCRR